MTCPNCGQPICACGETWDGMTDGEVTLSMALINAIEGMQEMISYVGPYFRDKHDYDGYIQRASDVLDSVVPTAPRIRAFSTVVRTEPQADSEQEELTQFIDDLVNRSFSPRMIAIEIIGAGWLKPITAAECAVTDGGHEYYELCAFCGAPSDDDDYDDDEVENAPAELQGS